MDTAKRDAAAREFVSACGSVYKGIHGPPPIDLQSVQAIADYADPETQKKYVHMYFAKYVTLWRVVRDRLPMIDPEADLLSVGAGPCLDLFGWHWDKGPSVGAVYGIDAQPWSAIRELKEWKRIASILVPTLTFQSGLVVPEPEHIPQAACVKNAKPFAVTKVTKGSTVLFPFSVNHCVGAKDGATSEGRKAFAAWISEARKRAARVIIGDMHLLTSTKKFWEFFCTMIGVQATPRELVFEDELLELQSLYVEEGHRRCSHYMSKAVVLVLDSQGARFLK